MRSAPVTLLCLALGSFVAGPAIRAGAGSGTVHDVFADFSGTMNPTPDATWTYGVTQTLGGALTLYTWVGNSEGATQWQLSSSTTNPKLGKNETGADITSGSNYLPATTYIHSHPGANGEYSVARWTAREAGPYTISAGFRSAKIAPSQATTDVHVVHNGTILASGFLNASWEDGEKVTFDGVINALAGDTVDFAVGIGNNGNYFTDRTAVRATISTTAPVQPPEAPTDLIASVSSGQPIQLRWTDASDNEEVFEVQRRTADTPFSWVADARADATQWEDLATQPGTEYTYRVRARNVVGSSAFTNEASAVAATLPPPQKPPADLVVVAATPRSIDLAWTDNCTNEIGFEIHRKAPGGTFSLVASTPTNTWSYRDAGLPPDASFVYGVRSVGAQKSSSLVECQGATLPTLSITPLRADLKDSPKFGRDSLKVQALFDFLPESPDGLFDIFAEGIGLRAGPADRPVVMTLPGGLDTWKVKGTKATWKSPKGSTPKYSIQVDTEKRIVKATASGLELPEPPANPMRVSITVGDDGGTARGDWETTKAGTFRLR